MDKQRNIELENWLIETTGEEMMANHLGPNWNRFHEECGFYPNISMTIADQVWEHKQKRIDELQARLDAFKAQSNKLRECSKSCVYNEREKNILLSQADDIDQILGVEQALKGGEL